ncbi:nesprin-2 isoform X1 [Carassius gibelio]|uniref:nesprin-2 isoform X1 n=1 Tax=Carassius gibelio TaxID=101364 RepID=UPI002278CD87|nr:nesprin-2 isoform X1 [Carassius gibelio]XP_052433263.1 nesprin-2 isoform X1 [Carassius gibelio]
MLEETSLKASHHGNTRVDPRGSDEEEKQTCVDMNPQSGLYLQSSETCFPSRSSQLHDDLKEFSECSSIGDLSQDASFSLESCIKLERRWMLWYEFKKELSCLDDWLRSAEKMAASPNSSHVLYVTAKEELQKYENLRAEARIRLTQLDGLTQRSRTLVGLFRGAMGARLMEMIKDCGQRWDQLSNTVETVCRRLKHFVCQREDFERQREEMAVWLVDLDLRLTEVEHFSGKDTCSKMHQLQGFQEAVGESAGRLNDLLQHGEELIQRSEPADAQAIENQLQELLLHCTRVFQGLGHLHTRLLSMRLVFEEDWALCAPDSGCPSESMLEDECFIDRSMAPRSSQDHLVLEWDPSVDIGGSISHDGTDSSSFSAAAGVPYTDEPAKYAVRRRVYMGPVDSQPDNAAVSVKQPGIKKSLENAAPPQRPVPVIRTGKHEYAGPFKTRATPETGAPESVTFDPERISAWLGQTHQLCSKAVQTEHDPQARSSFSSLPFGKEEEGEEYQESVLPQRRPHPPHTCFTPCPSQSCDLQHHSYQRHEDPQRQQERLCFPDSLEDNTHAKSSRELCGPKASAGSLWHSDSWHLGPLRFFNMRKASAPLLVLLFALLLAVVIWPLIRLYNTSCHQSNTLTGSFHLALHYKGPPPT